MRENLLIFNEFIVAPLWFMCSYFQYNQDIRNWNQEVFSSTDQSLSDMQENFFNLYLLNTTVLCKQHSFYWQVKHFFTLYTNSLMRHVTNCSFFDSLGRLCLYSIMFFTVIVISTCLGLRRSALIKVCLILYINNIPIMNWSLLVTVTYVLLGSQKLWLIENMIISFSP